MCKRLFPVIILVYSMVFPVLAGNTDSVPILTNFDSIVIEVRQPDSAYFSNLLHNPDFIYADEYQSAEGLGFFTRLLRYLMKILNKIFHFSKSLPIVFQVLLLIGILSSFYLILSKTRFYKIFYSGHEVPMPDYSIDTPIGQLTDYDAAISMEVLQKNYRGAIRLFYLKVIDQLNSQGFIHYSKEKTNVDYMFEMRKQVHYVTFMKLTLVYNTVWYGERRVNEEEYLLFEKSFNQFFDELNE